MKLIDTILENARLFNALLLEDRISVLKTKFVDTHLVHESVFNKIVEADPTRNKEYVQWLLNRYVKDVIRSNYVTLIPGLRRVFLEDLDSVSEALSVFHAHKKKFEKRDINQYTIPELRDKALQVSNSLSDAERAAVEGDHRYIADMTKFPEYKIGEVAGFTVWKLPQKDEEAEAAACELGKETSWCTRNGAFKTYNRKDPLYIFIGKGKKYQFHFSENQFKNSSDMDMKEGPLKDAFLDFLEKHEGRVTAKKGIEQYKVGEFQSSAGTSPIYKVGRDKYYTSIRENVVFYNPDDGLLKTKSGVTISDPSVIFSGPYMDFLKEVYRLLKEEGSTKGFRGIYRLLLGLDVPDKGPDHWWTVPGNLDLAGSELEELPEGLHIQGDLVISDSKIKELPKRLKVDGEVIR